LTMVIVENGGKWEMRLRSRLEHCMTNEATHEKWLLVSKLGGKAVKIWRETASGWRENGKWKREKGKS